MSNSREVEPDDTASISEFIANLSDRDVEAIAHDWRIWARAEQLAPAGFWTCWLIMGGRGSGKTRAGAEWVRELAMSGNVGGPIALVGETLDQARAIMVEGESGLLSIHSNDERPKFDRSRGRLQWPNGVEALLMSGSDPERFRGPQFAAAWSDEIAKWRDGEAAWDMLQFALRLGGNPRQVTTTTPRPTKLMRRLLSDENTVLTKMRTHENAQNLASSFLDKIVGRYEGTYLGRQELDGDLIEDLPDALWRRSELEAARCEMPENLSRIIVAVDPPVTGTEKSDACGIVVAGVLGEETVVLADRSIKPARPLVWARLAVETYHAYEADAIVAEINQGGDLVREMIAQIDPSVPVIDVRATRAKWVRAEPVAALYGRGMIKHVAGLNELEDEMCSFGPNGKSFGHSPDRVDALVWAVTELMLVHNKPRIRGF